MKRGDIWQGLLLVFVLTVLIAGAIACWRSPVPPEPTPWANGTECPGSDRANPWCNGK